jgi:mono/diheme cytochrome c family protein
VLSFLRISSETSHIFARYILSRSLALLAVILPVLATAQTAAPQLTSNPIFEKQCAKCHGKTAEGRHFAGPSLVSGKSTSLSEEDLRNIISNGKGRMPKYAGKLSADEINTLAHQITEARGK